MKKMNTLKACLFFTLLFPLSAWSSEVLQVKGQKVLIDMKGDEFMAGEEFFIINPANQKKTAIIRVKQTKNGRAVADLIKGRANPGDTLQAKGSSTGSGMSAEVREARSPRASASSFKTLRASWGLQAGMLMTKMDAKTQGPAVAGGTPNIDTTVAMKGSSFGVDGYYNYLLMDSITANLVVGLQQFDASGTADVFSCNNKTDKSCDVKITYLSFYGLGRWYFLKGQVNAWAGAGFGYLMAMTKKSSILNESQISSNQVYSLAFGAEYNLSRKNYIPFSFEYHVFPDSSSVKANMMILKAGYGWYF